MSFAALQAATEWPSVDNIRSFDFALDGGGRELIYDVLEDYSDPLMIEVGCFLCGSTLQWLKAHPRLKIIGVDPWPSGDSITRLLQRYDADRVYDPCFSDIPDRAEFIDSTSRHGFFASALANVKDYRDRFVPFQGKSPDALRRLAQDWFSKPDIIYIDAGKVSDDLEAAYELFPQAMICGDDWGWGADQGYPMQKAVNAFAETYGYRVDAHRQTWVIHRSAG